MTSCGKEGDEGLGATMHLPQACGVVTELGAPPGRSPRQPSSAALTLNHQAALPHSPGEGLGF